MKPNTMSRIRICHENMTTIIPINLRFSEKVPIKFCNVVRLGRHSDRIVKINWIGQIIISTKMKLPIGQNHSILSRHSISPPRHNKQKNRKMCALGLMITGGQKA